MRRAASSKGLSLLELMVVMVLLSLALTLAGPAITSGMDGMSLRLAARQVLSAFRLARDEARFSQLPVTVVLRQKQAWILRDNKTLRTIELPVAARMTSQEEFAPVVFLPTGQVVTANRFELVTDRGRTGRFVIEPAARIRFVEGQ